MARTRPPMTNDDARSRADKLGCTPIGPHEFSTDILGKFKDTVTQARYETTLGKGPKTPLPDPTWTLSDKRLAWPIAIASAYRAARDAGLTEFRPPRVTMPRELTPIGTKDIVTMTGKPVSIIHKWIERGEIPEATWIVGGQRAWALGVIEDWWKGRQERLAEQARTSARTQGRIARELVASMKEAGLLELGEDGLVTVASTGTIDVDPLEVVALEAI